MSQLKTVFCFEFLNYVKKKSFIVLTLILVAAMALVLSWPRIQGLFGGGTQSADGGAATQPLSTIGLVDETNGLAGDATFYSNALKGAGYVFRTVDAASAEAALVAGEVDSVVTLEGPLQYRRLTNNVGMYDSFDSAFSDVMLAQYRAGMLTSLGVSEGEISKLLSAEVRGETEVIASGKDQTQSFFYTYILMMLLYFAIIMYGQFVATSVATEKSSRAMELLITTTRPQSLLFGKVLGAGMAGLLQLVLIMGSAYMFYNLNAGFYLDNFLVRSVFDMPLSILLYTVLFFILGFYMYAFLFAAFASLVSRMEDLSTATLPITFMFIIAFMIVMMSMVSGAVDSPLMVFSSYFPLTSPMAMFARVAMGQVAGWQVAFSVAILLASTIGIGLLAAAVYRIGVLLYGNPPKPKEIVRLLQADKRKQ